MRVSGLLAITALWTASLLAQSGLQSRVEAAVQTVRAQIPGLAVAVVVDGRVAYAQGYGASSLTEPKLITPDTQFRLASLTKPFTAVAVMQLVAQGRVDIDRPANQYCAPLTALNDVPTVRHFLIHQSGMRHTSDAEDENIKVAPPNLAASLAGIVKEKLRFAPGQKTLYTSWGYTVLGCVIESVSGRSYAAFVQDHILTPAAMRNTTFDTPEYAVPTFSPGFRMRGGKMQPSVVVDTRFKSPSSGLISTVNDLSLFAIALFERTLLPDAQFKEMLSTRKAPGDERQMFTAGWTLGRADVGAARFNYNGSMEGTTAYLAIVPERRVAVALLANRERYVPEVTPVMAEALAAALAR